MSTLELDRSDALRLGPRSILTIAATSLVGLIAFGWPLLAAPGSSAIAHASDAPWLFAIVVPLMLAVVVASFTDGGMDAKAVALLGVLAAVVAVMRPLGGGTAGLEPIWVVLVLGGRALGPGFGFAADAGAVGEAVESGTSLVHELLRLLPLGAGVSTATKAAAIVALTRAVEGSAAVAAEVRDGVEAAQLLRTLPSVGADLRQELEAASAGDCDYDAALAFCDLLRALAAHVPLHGLGRTQRAPGVLPHVRFVVEDLLLQHARRPLRAGRRADRWKMAFGPLAVLLELLSAYRVHHPAAG